MTAVVNVMVKRHDFDHVMYGFRETSANEPLMTHRNQTLDGTKTGVARLLREQHGSDLLTGHVVSGVQEA
jgi:hypothetical protein